MILQGQEIAGTVRTEDGKPAIGANVIVKNTTIGTLTKSDGTFSVRAGKNDSLIISFIGYISMVVPVSGQTNIEIILVTDVTQPGEVFVTALGVSKRTQATHVDIAKVPGITFTKAKENNFGNTLQGQVTGVDVYRPSTGPAGASRIIIRGNKSFNSLNTPLYVVDGIPVENVIWGQAGQWGGADWGDMLTSFNPDDIESVSVLKGAAATALYGAKGGYGVINIITKKGSPGKGIGIEFNSGIMLENIINLSDLQTEYGGGGLGLLDPADPSSPRIYTKPATQMQAFNWGVASSWGPRFDGKPSIQFDGAERPYSYTGDNWKRFYQTGHSWTNSLSLTGGNENQLFRFSFADMKSTYVIPRSGFDRINASISASGKSGKKLSYTAKILYSNEKIRKRPYVSDSPGNAGYTLWNLPGNINIDDLLGDPGKPGAVPSGVITPDPVTKNTGEEYSPSGNIWIQNPWWVAYQFNNYLLRNRIIASASLKYNILDWLYIQGKTGLDLAYCEWSLLIPEGTSYNRIGRAEEEYTRIQENNLEWTLGAEKEFSRIGINAFIGGNKMTHVMRDIWYTGDDFIVPFNTSINNTQSQAASLWLFKNGINSLFGSAEISLNKYFFITATGRNDWFSVLPVKNNSKFYPSIGGSLLFTEALNISSDVLSYGKARIAWGQVATVNLGAYNTFISYNLVGQGHLGLPLGSYGFDSFPNPDVAPGLTTELELGTDLRFFNGKISTGFTYYNQKTEGDILMVPVSKTTGFNKTALNIGEMSNKGIEMIIGWLPVTGPLKWDISLNLSRNWNKVINLGNGINEMAVENPRTRTVFVKHIVGYPFAMITGYVQKTDGDGNKVYDSNGQPVRSDGLNILGNGNADIIGGLSNSLTYKRITLGISIDFKSGGELYSGTNVKLTLSGLTKRTLTDREGGFHIEGVRQSGLNSDNKPVYEPITLDLNQQQIYNYWKNLGECDQASFIYDASFIKLRQVSLGYSLPPELLNKISLKAVEISFVSRNLAILFNKVENVDPESSYNISNARGLDYFGLPGTRTYGCNLKIVF